MSEDSEVQVVKSELDQVKELMKKEKELDIDVKAEGSLGFYDDTGYKYSFINNGETYNFYKKDGKLVFIKYSGKDIEWEVDSQGSLTVNIDGEDILNPDINDEGVILSVNINNEEIVLASDNVYKYSDTVSFIKLKERGYRMFLNGKYKSVEIGGKEISYKISDTGIVTSSVSPHPVMNFDNQGNLITYELDGKICLAFSITEINDKKSYASFIEISTGNIVVNKERNWVANLDNYKTDQHLLVDGKYIKPEERIKEIGLAKKNNRTDVTYKSKTLSGIRDINDVKISNSGTLKRLGYQGEQCIIGEIKKVGKHIYSKLYNNETGGYLGGKMYLNNIYKDVTLDGEVKDPFVDDINLELNSINEDGEIQTHLFEGNKCLIIGKRGNIYELHDIKEEEPISGIVYFEGEFHRIEILGLGEDYSEEYPSFNNNEVQLEWGNYISNPDINEKGKIHIQEFDGYKYIPLAGEARYYSANVKTFSSLDGLEDIHKIIKKDGTFGDITMDGKVGKINSDGDKNSTYNISGYKYHRLDIGGKTYRFAKEDNYKKDNGEEVESYEKVNSSVPLIGEDGEIILISYQGKEYILRHVNMAYPLNDLKASVKQFLLSLVDIDSNKEIGMCLSIDGKPVMPILEGREGIRNLNNNFEIDGIEYKNLRFDNNGEAIITRFSYEIKGQGYKEFKNIGMTVFIESGGASIKITDSNLIRELIETSIYFEVKTKLPIEAV